jgi:hypothetical protein
MNLNISKPFKIRNIFSLSITLTSLVFIFSLLFQVPAYAQFENFYLDFPGPALPQKELTLLESSIRANCQEALDIVKEFNQNIENNFDVYSVQTTAAKIREVYILYKCGDLNIAVSEGNALIENSADFLKQYPKESRLLNKIMSLAQKELRETSTAEKSLMIELSNNRKSQGNDDLSNAYILEELAKNSINQENLAKARDFYIEAMQIRDEKDKDNFLRRRNVKRDLANIYLQLKDYTKAKDLLIEILDMTEKTKSPTDKVKESLAEAYIGIGDAGDEIIKNNNYGKASDLYLDLLSVETNPKKIINLKENLARCYSLMGIFAKEESVRLEIIQDYQKISLDPLSYDALYAKLCLLFLYRTDLKDQTKAAKIYHDLLPLITENIKENENDFGDNSEETYKAKAKQGLLYAYNGEYEKAKNILSNLLEDSKRSFGAKNSTTIIISDYLEMVENSESIESSKRV